MFYASCTELSAMQHLPSKENGLNSCINCYVIQTLHKAAMQRNYHPDRSHKICECNVT